VTAHTPWCSSRDFDGQSCDCDAASTPAPGLDGTSVRSEKARSAAPPFLDTLLTLAARLGEDEQRVLVAIAERLSMGAKQYGRLDLATDTRDWRREGAEEALDLAVYAACGLLSPRDR
jgi:hypothetical protein